MSGGPRVTGVTITPIAFADPPLLNASGVHQPYALRSIIEVHTDAELTGLSEAYGDERTLSLLQRVAPALTGLDVFDVNGLVQRTSAALDRPAPPPADDVTGDADTTASPDLRGSASAIVSAFEVALLDLQGYVTGRRVCDLLGGAVRETVPYSAYLFYRWAHHPVDPGYPEDDWGEALTSEAIVWQAKRMIEQYGFTSIKLKGGVRPPEEEIDAVHALREAFPDHPLRLDPNANWSVPTAIKAAAALEGVLEYLEDPARGIDGMAAVARETSLPLATNMCVTAFGDLPPAVRHDAVQVVLADHHFWGGLRTSQQLAAICDTFGLGLSMHSNTHLGISLAAMTHLAAATPNLTYACDTHSPWTRDEVIEPGALDLHEGSVRVPSGPGLGVRLDHGALARLHEQYQQCGVRSRDDVAAMRVADPTWTDVSPRF